MRVDSFFGGRRLDAIFLRVLDVIARSTIVYHIMPLVGTSSSGQFASAAAAQRTLRDLRTKRRGQPVLVLGHVLDRKGQEATFEVFNDRLAVVKFQDGASLGYDPGELLLPTEIDEKGTAYFEVRPCRECGRLFPLTAEECAAEQEPTSCPECASLNPPSEPGRSPS